MKHSQLTAVATVLLILLLAPASGITLRTAEESALNHVSRAMSLFREAHGHLPETWEEIYLFDSSLKQKNEGIIAAYGWRIQDRYQFVTQPLPMYQRGVAYEIDETSQVLLCRIIPFKDFRSQGEVCRTFIYKKTNGELAVTNLPEERAQKLFRTYGVTIRVAAGLPEAESNINRSQLEEPGSPPEPGDAKRVWPPAPNQPQAMTPHSPPSVTVSPTVAAPTSPNGTKSTALAPYLWIGAAIVILAARWIFLRTTKKIE